MTTDVGALASLARELGESVDGRPENVDAALPDLEAMLVPTADAEVVVEAVGALGRAWDARAAEILLARVPIHHHDPDVRLALAQSLPNGVADPAEPCWPRVQDALVILSADEDADVRDWACSGLGQMEAASPAALDALADRLADEHEDTRCEALWALAHAGDPRARRHLEERFGEGWDGDAFRLEVLAAAELADSALLPVLARMGAEWEGDEDEFTGLLARALRRCSPKAPTEAAAVERALVARIGELMRADGVSAAAVGRYPRTRLVALRPDGTPVVGFGWQVWDEEDDPYRYPLEQQAGSFEHSLRVSGLL